jgi:hypothetical protein
LSSAQIGFRLRLLTLRLFDLSRGSLQRQSALLSTLAARTWPPPPPRHIAAEISCLSINCL